MNDDIPRHDATTHHDASRHASTLPNAPQFTLTIDEAATLFDAAGVPKNPRTLQRNFEDGTLTCTKVETANYWQYMLDPTSVERRIKELKNVERIAVQHNPEAPRQTETDRGAPEQTTVHQDTPRHIRSDDEEGANLKTQVPSLEMDKIVRLSDAQQDKLKSWIAATLPRTTREVGGWIGTECGIAYESRSGLIALLHRLDMEHRKPKAVSSKLGPDKQAAFIKSYKSLLNHIGDDEAVLFGDAVHPTHAVRPVGCWAPKDAPLAVPQTSGRQRLNIHGAIDLEIGKTRRIEAAKVNAVSTIMLLRSRGCIRASG